MKAENTIRFGCVADDFTGASDAASFLAEEGVSTILYNGIPDPATDVHEAEAAVIALKCRTQEAAGAVSDVIKAFRFLKKSGAGQLYYKYCSTFDSTEQGNIGPVLDALLEEFDIPFTLLCPSLPINQRVVKEGILYAGGKPLAETHMRNHPLTPMRQSRVKTLMEMQSRYPVFELGVEQLIGRQEDLNTYIQELMRAHSHFYLVPDYYDQNHGYRIVELFGKLTLLSGGSGLMEPVGAALASENKVTKRKKVPEKNGYSGQAILLAGSCSDMTLRQINDFKSKGGIAYQLHPLVLLNGSQTFLDVQDFLTKHQEVPVLIYSSAEPDEVKRVKATGEEGVARLLESTMSEVAAYALGVGRTKIIVAGGETSGAVTKRLGFSSYHIGKSVAPGVPIMIPLQNEAIRLVLKSGNFGQENFFWQTLKEI
ncbi:3-oxo-tetronate kinase [Lacrimispora sp.]|uniref:3-oxo-tetronate kinase n=1 Tax=Lacrimispora sp. TaxID=2719234 RepID=UPI002FDA2574